MRFNKIMLLIMIILLFTTMIIPVTASTKDTLENVTQEGSIFQDEELADKEPGVAEEVPEINEENQEVIEELEDDEKSPVEADPVIEEEEEIITPNEEIEAEEDELLMSEEAEELKREVGLLQTGPIDVQNYFPASGTSTNDHYSVVGVYVATNGDVHLILDNDKNTANQTRFHSPKLNGQEAAGYELKFGQYEDYWEEIGTSRTLTFPDGSNTTITGVRLFDFNLGPMTQYLQEENTLQMLNQADGFSISGMTFNLNLGHKINKTVNKDNSVTIDDELIYTIVVTNTGEFILSGVNVYDDVPDGLMIIEVSDDNVNWDDPDFTPDGDVILDTGLTLEVGASKTYYLKAKVNDAAYDGQTIINTAYTGGSVPREEDTAEVDVYVINTIDVTVEKFITGNFGNLSRKFDFTVNVDGETYNFELSHEGSEVIKGLPANTLLTLTEESGDYEVTVVVGEDEILPNAANEYTTHLSQYDEDVTITVTNHKDIIIDTGLSFDSLPYALILGLAALGFGIVVVRRQRFVNKD